MNNGMRSTQQDTSASLSSAVTMTPSQAAAIRCIHANHGEASEGTIWLEGLNRVRNTMKSLERRGLVVRGEYLNETDGYVWKVPT